MKEAKQIYSEFINYRNNKQIDKLLLFNGLNNLCLLEKYYKNYSICIEYSLQNIKEITKVIKQLKRKQQQKQSDEIIVNLAIILVNFYKLTKSCIQQILIYKQVSNQQQQQYLKLLYDLNIYGYKTCKTYLGQASFFIRFFNTGQRQNLVKQSVDEVKEKQSYLQLHSQKYQNKSQNNQFSFNLFRNFAKGKTLNKQTIQINSWIIQIEFTKSINQKYGQLSIISTHKQYQKKIQQKIIEQRLQKLLSIIYIQDNLPYQYSKNKLPQKKLIQLCIIPYLEHKDDGSIRINPKSKGILNQFIFTKFFNYKCIVALNHIICNKFRISISPLEESGSLYLNIQLTERTINLFFQILNDPIPSSIRKQYLKLIYPNSQKFSNFKKYIQIKDKHIIQHFIINLLPFFEQFLRNQEQGFQNLLQAIEAEQIFYKFKQQKIIKGTFFKIHFMQSILSFNIYLQKFYHYKNSNNKKIKGQRMFTKQQFFNVFGIQIECQYVKSYIKRFCEIISDKYYLNDYKNLQLLNEKDHNSSNYLDNLILERNFNFNYFKIKLMNNQNNQDNYLSLITVTILTIENQLPIGIRISQYNSEYIKQNGYFIDLNHQNWYYPNFQPTQNKIMKFNELKNQITINNNKKFQIFQKGYEQFQFMKKYFLGYWMNVKGFEKILQQVINPNSELYMGKNINKVINWEVLFQEQE